MSSLVYYTTFVGVCVRVADRVVYPATLHMPFLLELAGCVP